METGFYKELINRLRNLGRREYALFVLLGIEAVLFLGITVFTAFTFLESLFYFSSSWRTVLFFVFICFVLVSAGLLFIYPLIRYLDIGERINYFEKARLVGFHFPEVKDDLINAMQLVSSEETRRMYSSALIDEAFRHAYKRTEHIDFNSIVSFRKAKEMMIYLGLIAVVCISLVLLIPGAAPAAERLIQFDREFLVPARFTFEVFPGNMELTKGDNLGISVTIKGVQPSRVYLALKTEEEADFENHELQKDSAGAYNYYISQVRSSFVYYAFAEDAESDQYRITVTERPVIKNLDISIIYPQYSGIPPHQQKDNGNITALTGSRVQLKVSSTKELTRAKLIFEDTLELDLKAEGFQAVGSFNIRQDYTYRIIVNDEAGNVNLNPIIYEIRALQDAYPLIEMLSPNRNTALSNDSRIPLAAKISDDFGFSKLLINYRLSSSKYEAAWGDYKSIEIPVNKSIKEIEAFYVWNLTPLSLAVDDVVTYYLEVFDNDNISGPKSAKTAEFTVRVPSLDEILAQADNTHKEVQNDLKETLKEAEELKETIEKIDRELKQDKKELTWDEKENIEKALQKFEDLQQKMTEAGENLNQMKEELQENNLLSKETLEKYMELQKLIDELSSDEMKKAMERLQQMLEQLNRKNTQQAFEQFKMDEERFKKGIERTMNLLKRLQVEQKIDELVKRTEELSKKQEKAAEQTAQKDLSSERDRNEMSSKQEEISRDLEKLKEEMDKLAEKMSEMDDMPTEEMENAQQEFEKQQNEELSEQAKQNIKQSKKQQAQQNQQKLSGNMKKMNEMMQQMQESMMQMNQMQTFTDMMRLLENLLNLSKQQEELRKDSEILDPNSSQFKNNMQKQDNIQRNLDKIVSEISELSQKTFAITPEMGKALGDAKRQMSNSLEAMQNRNKANAFNNQGEAMGSLNEAASLMKGSMESMMQGGGSGGMMSLMQQMGQLSQQQMNLNNMTQMLQQGQDGKLSPQQQAQLQRLSQQQDLIRKSVDQLNKEARESGESKSLPGSLEKIAKEMQEIISNMNTQKLDDNLIQKQERILSRMLDIQKSINERDFEKKRESNTGENIVYESPAELNLSTGEGKDKLRDELNRAVREGYSRDYELLIRRYYELLREKNK